MKKTSCFLILVLISLILSACSAVAASTPTRTGSFRNGGPNSGLPFGLELAVGTLALQKTSTPIDAKQAADLLFLWKGLAQMLKAQNAAREEVQGLLHQIQAAMTPDQMKAIQDMKLNFQQAAQIGQQYGLQIGLPGGSRTDAPRSNTTPQASRQRNAGGFTGGGGMPGFGGRGQNPFNSAQSPTYNAFQDTGLTAPVVEAVIQYLAAIAQQ